MKQWLAALAIGTLALSMAASAEISFMGKDSASISFSGDVQYRFEYDYIAVDSANGGGKAFSSGDYWNKYAWNLFVKAAPFKNLLVGLRLSNPAGYNLDQVAANLSHYGASPAPVNGLSVAEMYLKWTAGMFTLSAGIIPVIGNTVLDLTLFETNGYQAGGFALPGLYPWAVGMNNSLKAAQFDFAFYNSQPFSIGLNVIAAMDSDYTPVKFVNNTSPSTGVTDELKLNQYRIAASIPMSILNKMITISPEMNLHTDFVHSNDMKTVDNVFTGGIDLGVKPTKELGIKAGFAAGGYDNEIVATATTAPMGILAMAAVNYTYLPGTTAMVDFDYGTTVDRDAATKVNRNILYWDIKNPFPVMKLVLIPRIRIWYWTNSADDQTKLQVRPELNVRAAF